jgi:hypothetical protein
MKDGGLKKEGRVRKAISYALSSQTNVEAQISN